jgi:ABC-type transporter Mla MlaB component
VQLALTEARGTVAIDLSGVTLLASAGVNALYDLLATAQAAGIVVELIAPPGSAAAHVITLTGLD